MVKFFKIYFVYLKNIALARQNREEHLSFRVSSVTDKG